MELLTEAYFGKSFMMIGDELSHCFNCKYCRANDGLKLHHNILPSEINPLFREIPVAVNCFYGDPFLQPDNTFKILDRLIEDKHVGPVIVITKGDVTTLPTKYKVLNLHIGLSTFGYCKNDEFKNIDGGDWERFKNNAEYLKNNRFRFHIEFRPIINGINDSGVNIEPVFEVAAKYEVPIAYSGLQVSDNLAKRLKEENINFEPYDERGFGLKKFVSKKIEDVLNHYSFCYDIPIYKKTSCLISSVSGYPDYNAHYYRPNEVGCRKCTNRDICGSLKDKHDSHFLYDDGNFDDIIPFDYEIVYANNHKCSLFENGLCKFPTNDCTHINGRIIKINEPITTTDVRLIKWLTGYTVDAEFIELPYISKKWKKN